MDLSFKLSDNSKKLENFVKDTNATFADLGSFSDIGSYESARMQKYPALQNYS